MNQYFNKSFWKMTCGFLVIILLGLFVMVVTINYSKNQAGDLVQLEG